MKRDPEDPQLALSMDVLAPEGYGEIIGGGQREDDLGTLEAAIEQHELPREAFEWYLDLRRYGTLPARRLRPRHRAHGRLDLRPRRTCARPSRSRACSRASGLELSGRQRRAARRRRLDQRRRPSPIAFVARAPSALAASPWPRPRRRTAPTYSPALVTAKNTLRYSSARPTAFMSTTPAIEAVVHVVGVVQNQREHRHHLHRGLVLAAAARGDHHALADRDGAQRRHRQLARGDDDHRPAPARCPCSHHQHQRGQHDQLVGQRVEELAEHAGQAHAPRQLAVDEVGHGRRRVQHHRPEVRLARVAATSATARAGSRATRPMVSRLGTLSASSRSDLRRCAFWFGSIMAALEHPYLAGVRVYETCSAASIRAPPSGQFAGPVPFSPAIPRHDDALDKHPGAEASSHRPSPNRRPAERGLGSGRTRPRTARSSRPCWLRRPWSSRPSRCTATSRSCAEPRAHFAPAAFVARTAARRRQLRAARSCAGSTTCATSASTFPLGESALVFLAGFVMSVTPGKVGEVFKSLLLYEIARHVDRAHGADRGRRAAHRSDRAGAADRGRLARVRARHRAWRSRARCWSAALLAGVRVPAARPTRAAHRRAVPLLGRISAKLARGLRVAARADATRAAAGRHGARVRRVGPRVRLAVRDRPRLPGRRP